VVALRTGIAVLAVLACLAAPAAASAADPVIGAAGDIACASFSATSTSCQQKATSDLLVGAGYAKVLSLGDEQYENGTLAAFNTYYEASWGRVKAITAPVPGNHEYQTSGASGYYSYFGALAGPSGKGYYSFDLGSWHLVGLNSNCSKVSCSAGSAQEQWLRSDLAAHPRQCVLAFFHHANLSAPTTALRQAFLAAGGDVILTGHNHVYRRLGPRDASLNADPAGYREFIVGTGGKSVSGSPFGILQLTLHSASYDWKFISIAHATGDTGSASCNPPGSPPPPPPPDTTPPPPDQTPPAPLKDSLAPYQVGVGGQALQRHFQRGRTFLVTWSAKDEGSGVASYDVRYRRTGWRASSRAIRSWLIATTVTHARFRGHPGSTYCFSTRARDRAGNVSRWSRARCTALPLDDRSLTAKGAWRRARGSGFYLDTVSTSRANRATLVRVGVRARRLSLVVTRCPGCGTVRVYWKGSLLRTVQLGGGEVRRRQIVRLGAFDHVTRGSVLIRVTSVGKPVAIDGLGVSSS
jgi:calcineurin-like phosphoesterase family protein